MKFFDPVNWERVRAQGRRRFVQRLIWKYFFPAGLLIVGFSFWSMRRLQVELSWPVSALWPFFWLGLFFSFIAFPLVGATCALLTWHISERLYLRHRAVPH
jgi:hypothetical protein